MKKKQIIIAAVIAALLIITVLSVGYRMIYWKAFAGNNVVEIYIDTDDNADSLQTKIFPHLRPLALKGWKLLDRIDNQQKIRTGYYRLPSSSSTIKAYKTVKHGMQTPVKLVLNNVRTNGQLAGKIAKQIMLDSTEIIKALNDTAICRSYGYAPNTIIAMFIPNTYEVYWDMSIDKLLKRMDKEHMAFWNQSRLAKAEEIGLTPLEVSILASIVEEETAVNDEKPMVAGLYINRLKRGIPLQADPTVKFAVGDFTLKRILHKHLETDSPYNTYKVAGLPPGPIRMPSINGLNSVLNYQNHSYIYMCAKEDFSGRHNFATTLAQHNANARRYQNALNRRGIK